MFLVSENETESVNTDLCLGFKVKNNATYTGDPDARWVVEAITKNSTVILFTTCCEVEAKAMHEVIINRINRKDSTVNWITGLIFSEDFIKSVRENENTIKNLCDIDALNNDE